MMRFAMAARCRHSAGELPMGRWSGARVMTAVALALCAALCGARALAAGKPFIPWTSLSNPILSYPNWSIKDVAMSYRQGEFYLYFSAFYPEKGEVRSHVVEVSTRDFVHFSQPLLNFDGEDDGWAGMCSPDVQRIGKQYILTFNSWGDKRGKPNELFYMTSADMVHWSARRPMAPNLTGANRVIDASVAAADGGYYLIWKEGSPSGGMHPRLAFAKSLDGPFAYVGSGLPSLLMEDGAENGLIHENYEFMHAKNQWYLLTTDYVLQGPHRGPAPDPDLRWSQQGPRLYALAPGSSWLKWQHGYALDIAPEKFNTVNRDNASAVYDWRAEDGYYYLIYAGCTERESYAGRGWNQLGLARSKDLVHWTIAGQTQGS